MFVTTLERDQVFIGKTNGSSCRKSRPKPLIQPHSSTDQIIQDEDDAWNSIRGIEQQLPKRKAKQNAYKKELKEPAEIKRLSIMLGDVWEGLVREPGIQSPSRWSSLELM